jgi:predicted phosphodiesterase
MQLKDSEELKLIIENQADLLLFGHYHRDKETATRTYHGTWGIPRCYNAGSSTHKNGETGFQWIIDAGNDDPSADFDARFI